MTGADYANLIAMAHKDLNLSVQILPAQDLPPARIGLAQALHDVDVLGRYALPRGRDRSTLPRMRAVENAEIPNVTVDLLTQFGLKIIAAALIEGVTLFALIICLLAVL